MAILEHPRSLVVASAVSIAAMLLVLPGPAAKLAEAQDAVPSTLQSESLDAESARNYPGTIDGPGEVTLEAVNCSVEDQGTGSISYTATGDATGPYPGTFTESGTFTLGDPPPDATSPIQRPITSFQAAFEIDSPATGTRVTGTKTAENVPHVAACYELPDGTLPGIPGTAQVTLAVPDMEAVRYEARIETHSRSFADRGTSYVFLREIGFSDEESSGELVQFSENFSSVLPRPEPLGLTKERCKAGGYERYGFSNQGDCVRFVETQGRNEPGQNQRD